MNEDPQYEGFDATTKNTIVFNPGTETTPILRIDETGFYVRGVRVPQDDKEAQTVYNAFKKFLIETELRRAW